MESSNLQFDELLHLENLLGSGSGSNEELAQTLADGCVEFGASGRRYNKRQILYAIKRRKGYSVTILEFQAQSLGPDVVLVTYFARRHAEDTQVCSLRSSVWGKKDGIWQLLFHQGTPTSCT